MYISEDRILDGKMEVTFLKVNNEKNFLCTFNNLYFYNILIFYHIRETDNICIINTYI